MPQFYGPARSGRAGGAGFRAGGIRHPVRASESVFRDRREFATKQFSSWSEEQENGREMSRLQDPGRQLLWKD